jgi:hypothetical protein
MRSAAVLLVGQWLEKFLFCVHTIIYPVFTKLRVNFTVYLICIRKPNGEL